MVLNIVFVVGYFLYSFFVMLIVCVFCFGKKKVFFGE